MVQKEWLTFVSRHTESGRSLPAHVYREFESFLQCGALANGFLRLKCDSCAHEKLIAFSCKKRGFCNSCGARRMSEQAVFLTDWVLPKVRVRQWVLSVPIPMRYWMARNPKLMGVVLSIFLRVITGFQREKAKSLGFKGGESGFVTLIQRFGGSCNLNVHFHTLAIEAVYRKVAGTEGPKVLSHDLPAPTTDEVKALLEIVQTRVVRALKRRGLIGDESEDNASGEYGDDTPELMELCQGASVAGRIGLGENAGQPVRRIGSFGEPGERAMKVGPRSAILGGFSLHAKTEVPPDERESLEKLCRYISRPAIAEMRLSEDRNGNIVYRFKKEWSDGTEAVTFTPLEFIEKLVALIPEPRRHLTRFHGVLAPNSGLRTFVVPAQPLQIAQADENARPRDPRRLTWAELLKRVFKIDLTTCPDCGGGLRFIATIMERAVVVKILTHLDLPTISPRFNQARAPPQQEFF